MHKLLKLVYNHNHNCIVSRQHVLMGPRGDQYLKNYIHSYIHIYIYIYVIYIYIYIYILLGTLVPNSRDRQGKLWLPKKQKTALKTTSQ